MNCEEFLRQFRDALDGKVSENLIQDNVNYYRSYIHSQTANGKRESDVLGMLGDPRLLAKTIEKSSKFASEGRDSSESRDGWSSYTGNHGKYANYSSVRSTDNMYTEKVDENRRGLPGWLITCIVMVVVFLVFSFVFRMFLFLAPYIMVLLLAGFLIRTVRNWWQRR